jgi:hypothetical protein
MSGVISRVFAYEPARPTKDSAPICDRPTNACTPTVAPAASARAATRNTMPPPTTKAPAPATMSLMCTTTWRRKRRRRITSKTEWYRTRAAKSRKAPRPAAPSATRSSVRATSRSGGGEVGSGVDGAAIGQIRVCGAITA